MTEILTLEELAQFLKMSKGQCYSMTRSRARVRMDHPLPCLRLNGNLRFRKSDVERWLDEIAKEEEAA
jgi:predicted DNA-binding transcriptional regulator AlpA